MRIAILIVATSLAACINTAPPESADNAVPDSAYYAPTTIAPHFSAVDVQLNVVLETPDGARLLTDVYRPSGIDSSISTVLIRVPYDKQNYTRAWGRFWARRGFNLVLQDVRGRFASATTSDEYEPFVSDIEDARVTVDWIIRQTWSNQKVAVMGASYYGYTALAAAVSKHPAIRCVAPGFTSPDLYETSFRQGALKLSTLGIFWLNMDGDPTTYQDVSRINTRGLPLAGIGATAGLEDRLWSNLIESWDSPAAEFRQSTDLADELLTINIPMLHSTGFYDNILGDHLRLWSRMATAAAVKERQWLLLGPWDHELTTSSTNRVGQLDIGSESRFAYADTIHAFFDFCLNDVENGFDKRPMVSYFTLGKNTWQDADTWPPKNVRFEDWYLSSNGRANGGTDRGKLSKSPSDGAAYDRFKYDPRNPVDLSASYDNWSAARYLPDRRAVEGRPDILFFDSELLTADMTVSGPLTVILYAASSAVDTDFVATLVDVHPNGYAHEVQHGIIRASYRHGDGNRSLLTPGEVYEYSIDLWSTSYLFRKNHVLRLEIASSDFDRYDRNLNTGEAPGTSSRVNVAVQTVYHSEEYPSRIVLPVEYAD